MAPDWFDASLLRAVALLGGFDVEQVLDDAGVAPDRRDPPFGIGTPEPPVRRDDRLLLWLAVALALLLGLLLGVLVARRGRSS